MSLEVEQAVLAKMPNAELAKIRGVADYPQLRKIQLQVFQNLCSVACPFGTGDDGHRGLGMTAAKYAQRAGQPVFNHPVDPGTYNMTIAHVSFPGVESFHDSTPLGGGYCVTADR